MRNLQPVILGKVEDLQDRRGALLLGPRQVGKTVLLQQVVSDLLDHGWPPGNVTYVDLSDERITQEISPRDVVACEPAALVPDLPRAILVDEIGRFAGWDRWLKQAVDTTPHRYVATDSAAALLADGSRESGLGRWDEYELETLSLAEVFRLQGRRPDAVLGSPDPVERYLRCGGFPEHALYGDSQDMRRRLRADLVERAIMRDLLRTGIRDLEKVRALFVYLVQDSGAMFSAAARSNDLGVDQRSVGEWVQRLLDTRLLHPLQRRGSPTYPSAGLRSRPRIYAADHSMVVAFSDLGDPFSDGRPVGRIIETVVARHLREVARERKASLSYFRTGKGDVEVDFVLDAGTEPAAIEVTRSRAVSGKKLRALAKAGTILKTGSLAVVYRGTVREERDGVHLIPLHELLIDPLSALEGLIS